MTRLFFVVAALYDFAWAAILLLWPERVMAKMPPTLLPMAALIGLIGLGFLACAVRVRRWIVALGLLAKIGGPLNFALAVSLGYLTADQWWMPLVNDLIWIPPLVMIWRAPGRKAPAPPA